MNIKLTFLGTGTSPGVPMIACSCPVCQSTDPRDQRTRTSALITLDDHNILIDTTPELRIQCLRNRVTRVHAVLITHTHADHIFGMDDLRRFNQVQEQPLNVYADREHMHIIEKVFGYARADRAAGNRDLPQLLFNPIDPENGHGFALFNHTIIPLILQHGRSRTLGYRVGPIAYCTDLSAMPENTLQKLQNLDILVLGALRPTPHRTHLTFDQAIELAQRIKAKNTYFVHLAHDVHHGQFQEQLPPNVHLAYDGLTITTENNTMPRQ